ncbi:MAG: transcriptional regulator [Gemmatimonadetes bacterium]|nr:MAG: transcriptional regulator [Gemmatimonadota bacterium]
MTDESANPAWPSLTAHTPSARGPRSAGDIGELGIARRRLTQARVAKVLGVSQPRVNDLVRGRLHRFSIDALVDVLARAGVRVHFRTERGARVA